MIFSAMSISGTVRSWGIMWCFSRLHSSLKSHSGSSLTPWRTAQRKSERRPVPSHSTIGHPFWMASSSAWSEIFPPLTRIMTRGAWELPFVSKSSSASSCSSAELLRLGRSTPERLRRERWKRWRCRWCLAETMYDSNSALKELSLPKAWPPTSRVSTRMECVWSSWISASGTPCESFSGASSFSAFAWAASTFMPHGSCFRTSRQRVVRPPSGLMPMHGTWRCLSCCFMAFPTISMTPLLVPPVMTQAPVRRAASTSPLEKLSASKLAAICMCPAPPMIERISFGSCSPHSGRITCS
mmetsp:Transcript_110091/g.322048  ORF Transcript_110091/g.322048 Transcript_110091/m.322048 type:complete len:298 (+) Transcript_110091:2162-3055(+)